MLESLWEQVPWQGGQSSLSSLTLEPRRPPLPLGGSTAGSLSCVLSPFTPQDSVRGKGSVPGMLRFLSLSFRLVLLLVALCMCL